MQFPLLKDLLTDLQDPTHLGQVFSEVTMKEEDAGALVWNTESIFLKESKIKIDFLLKLLRVETQDLVLIIERRNIPVWLD